MVGILRGHPDPLPNLSHFSMSDARLLACMRPAKTLTRVWISRYFSSDLTGIVSRETARLILNFTKPIHHGICPTLSCQDHFLPRGLNWNIAILQRSVTGCTHVAPLKLSHKPGEVPLRLNGTSMAPFLSVLFFKSLMKQENWEMRLTLLFTENLVYRGRRVPHDTWKWHTHLDQGTSQERACTSWASSSEQLSIDKNWNRNRDERLSTIVLDDLSLQ